MKIKDLEKKRPQSSPRGQSSQGRSEKREKVPGRRRGSKRQAWFRGEAQKWYILVGLSLAVALLLHPFIVISPSDYEAGDIAERDIKAANDFLVENKEVTEKRRQEAKSSVRPVYDFDPSAAEVTGRIKTAFREARQGLSRAAPSFADEEGAGRTPGAVADNPAAGIDALKAGFFETMDIEPAEGIFGPLFQSGFPEKAENALIGLLNRVVEKGVVGNRKMLLNHKDTGIILHNMVTGRERRVTDLERFYDLSSAEDFFKAELDSMEQYGMPPQTAEAVIQTASLVLSGNVTFNKRETELRKVLAANSVKPVYVKVKEGEMLVREGQRITPEHVMKLSEHSRMLRNKGSFGKAPAMAVLIGFSLAVLYLGGLIDQSSSKNEAKNLLFMAVTLIGLFLLVMASDFVSKEIARGFGYFTPRALLFAIPAACGAMLVSVFLGMRMAVGFSIVVSLLSCLVLGGQVEFFIYFFVGSLVGAYGVKDCRERGGFITTGLKVGVISAALALCIEVLNGSLYDIEVVMAVFAALIGGVLAGIIAIGLVPLAEMVFGYTTDIKLLELGSLDQPLLQELMLRAQGTYHHSIVVSNMVEATAKAVNANPLLAKVAAYYHDIGKVKKPLYFIENQVKGVNKHEKLAPSMSSLILMSHIKDGVELARKYNLGSEIIDIIRQHHGTSLISYFYDKALEQAERKGGKALKVKEEDFRYPGPKPQTKEAGLVMLADAVEAASKTLAAPTAARIQGMVQKIINKVFSDGQLDECELTLKDLNEIAKSFNKTLSGIYHHRIEYPETAVKAGPGKVRKGENGGTDQHTRKSPADKKTKDQAKPGESLRRLGM